MDPVAAAGSSLSAAFLAIQLLGGCIQGYEIFLDMFGMPAKLEHLVIRIRLEQTRLLNWTEQVGLLSEVLKEPSVTLQLHRNIIIHILLNMQQLFKDFLQTQAKFEVPSHSKDD